MDAEKPGRKPASRDSGNKVNTRPFIRKPRLAVPCPQILGSEGAGPGGCMVQFF